MDVSAWTAHWGRWCPGKVGVRFEGRDITYAEMEDAVARLAGGLVDHLGVRPGDRVAYLGANTPELLELLFACARVGAVLVPLNVRMPAAELRVFVDDSEPCALVVEAPHLETAAQAVAQSSVAPRLLAFSGYTRAEGLEEVMQGARPVPYDEDSTAWDAAALIAYTSGTTGRPRGAVLTHEALFFNALNAVAAFALTAADEVLTNIPMFHVGGLNILTTPAISAGATVTVHPRFDPEATLVEVERTRTTLMISVPVMTRALSSHPAWEATHLSSLRCVATGSTFVGEEALRPWLDRGIAVSQVYGLTETCPIATVVPVPEAPRMAATAGRPAMHCRVRVVDPSGAEVGVGEVGEVLLRGPNVMREYWRNADATREAFVDGWFRSGDAGFLDDEGFLHVVERLKDIIVVAGSNVYPADVEAVLAECTHVAEAAVVGRPDADLGEVPVAYVVLKPGSDMTAGDVLALFDGRLAPYKHPRDVVFVDALPRTALGKVQRSVLRRRASSGSAQPAPLQLSPG